MQVMYDQQKAAAAERNDILNNIPALSGNSERKGFVIKVYSLIFLMLATTIAFCLAFMNIAKLQVFALNNLWLYYTCLFLVIFITIGMTCLYKKCRAVPLNYIMLGIYTLAHSYMVALITLLYDKDTVFMAFACTAGMFMALTTYACFTKTDLTYMGGALSTSTMMVVMFLILFSFFRNKILNLVVCLIMVVLLSFWIIYDTQIVLGGGKYEELTLDDYCLGALIIYSDVITLFLYLLQLLGGSK